MHLIVRFIVGVFEVVGGILGVAVIATGAFTARSIDPLSLCFALLYTVTILAGVGLLRGYRFGGALSLLVQCAQLPRIAVVGCVYHFAAGAGLWIMIGNDGFNVSYALGSQHLASAVTSAPMLPFGVNVVAAFALSMLLTAREPKNARKKRDKRRRLAFA